jgi:hypothetical protein
MTRTTQANPGKKAWWLQVTDINIGAGGTAVYAGQISPFDIAGRVRERRDS